MILRIRLLGKESVRKRWTGKKDIRRIGVRIARDVLYDRIVAPAGLPELVEDVRVLFCPHVPLVMLDLLLETKVFVPPSRGTR